MNSAQLVVVEGDNAEASALFSCESIEVRSAQDLNGEVKGRHVVVIGRAEWAQQFAREMHGYAASVHTCVGEIPGERAAAWRWAKEAKKEYVPESTQAAYLPSDDVIPLALPDADLGGLSGSPDEPVGNLTAAVIPAAGVDTRPTEAQPSDPLNQPQAHASGDWTVDIPPDPQSAPKPPKRVRRAKLHAVDGNTALATNPDPEPLPAELSEDALAGHFVETCGENWRYVPEWGIWLHWKGDGWYRDTRHEVGSVLMRVTREALTWREAQALTADGKRKVNSKRTAWNSRDVAAVDPRISILAEELDADPMILGVPGGVVDLTNGKLLDAVPEQYVTRRCSVAPADGPTPLFDRVLARACAGHDGMREYLLRWFGYMLTGDVREEAFMFLHGPGGSGKSTLIKCITEIMGDYALTISMDALTESKNERHSQEIAKLEGARLVYASETEEGRRFKESLIKLLTGGDKIVAHRMRMDDREYKPTFKMLVYGNSMPHLKSVGEEMRRRIHLVEYAGSLSEDERDTTLKQRLVEEYPAILALLVRGCVDWQDCAGLGKPESVTASVEEYLEGEDTLGTFLEEATDRHTRAKALSGVVYRRYVAWCGQAGERYVMSQKVFVQALKQRGFEPRKSAGVRMIFGLELLQQQGAPDERPHWQQD